MLLLLAAEQEPKLKPTETHAEQKLMHASF